MVCPGAPWATGRQAFPPRTVYLTSQEGPDRKPGHALGTDFAHSGGPAGESGGWVPAPTGFHTSVQGLSASQYFPFVLPQTGVTLLPV